MHSRCHAGGTRAAPKLIYPTSLRLVSCYDASVKRLGAYEAKTHLSRLLDEVERGETYTITKHGRPVALLVPAAGGSELTVAKAIAGLRRFRQGRRLDGIPLRELIGEDRRR
jgi:prevent-host-death family protein